jgi:CHAT domain-containing protein
LKDPVKGMPEERCFLGQMGLVRWLHQAGWPPEIVKVRNGRARYVVPEYPVAEYVLPGAAKEPEFLKTNFKATAVIPQPNEVRDLLQHAGSFDLLHFACHGFAESENISNAQLMLQGRLENKKYVPAYLSATTAAQFSNLRTDDNRPMVVLNACQVARSGYTLTGLGGFSQAFINAGAGCFVGSLWSVGDQPARTFAETLYRQLLQGKVLSDAANVARMQAEAAGEATWLAYAVYGHPYMKMSSK